jgi:hypothetical protein
MHPFRFLANEQGRMSASLAGLCASAVLLGSPGTSGAVPYALGWSLVVVSLLLPLYSRLRKG